MSSNWKQDPLFETTGTMQYEFRLTVGPDMDKLVFEHRSIRTKGWVQLSTGVDFLNLNENGMCRALEKLYDIVSEDSGIHKLILGPMVLQRDTTPF